MRLGGEVVRALLEWGEQVVHILRGAGQQTLSHAPGYNARGRVGERGVEELQRAALGSARVGAKPAVAALGLLPACRYRDEDLMEALGAAAEQAEPAQQHHARDRVGYLSQAGTRDVVVDEPLGAEAREQPLSEALVQV